MPLFAPEPPQQVAEAVQSTFRAMTRKGHSRSPALRNAPAPLALTQPHQIFSLGLADLVAGRGLEAAKPTGWRYLVQDGDNVLASAETVSLRRAGACLLRSSTQAAWSRRPRRRSERLKRFPR